MRNTQYIMPPIDRLIADFDETVSEVDTIDLLVQAAIKRRLIAAEAGEQASLLLDWRGTVECYSMQYARIVDEWLACGRRKAIRTQKSPPSPLDLAGLPDFLKAFEALEQTSIRRVIGRKFLSGLTRETLRALGRSVQKKPGVFKVLEAMHTMGVKIEILSANWSKTLIEGAMEGMCDKIIANGLAFDAAGRSTGQIHLQVVSAQDKLRHFLRRKCVSSLTASSQGREEQQDRLEARTGRTLYIGDSISDFLAIFEADIGVLIGANRTAIRTIEQFGLPTRIVADWDRSNPVSHGKGTILRVDSWERLGRFLKNETLAR